MFVTNDIEILAQLYSIKKRMDLPYINRITIYSKMYSIVKSPNTTTMPMPASTSLRSVPLPRFPKTPFSMQHISSRSSSPKARKSTAIRLTERG